MIYPANPKRWVRGSGSGLSDFAPRCKISQEIGRPLFCTPTQKSRKAELGSLLIEAVGVQPEEVDALPTNTQSVAPRKVRLRTRSSTPPTYATAEAQGEVRRRTCSLLPPDLAPDRLVALHVSPAGRTPSPSGSSTRSRPSHQDGRRNRIDPETKRLLHRARTDEAKLRRSHEEGGRGR